MSFASSHGTSWGDRLTQGLRHLGLTTEKLYEVIDLRKSHSRRVKQRPETKVFGPSNLFFQVSKKEQVEVQQN